MGTPGPDAGKILSRPWDLGLPQLSCSCAVGIGAGHRWCHLFRLPSFSFPCQLKPSLYPLPRAREMWEKNGKRPFAERIRKMGIQPGGLPGVRADSHRTRTAEHVLWPVMVDGAVLMALSAPAVVYGQQCDVGPVNSEFIIVLTGRGLDRLFKLSMKKAN